MVFFIAAMYTGCSHIKTYQVKTYKGAPRYTSLSAKQTYRLKVRTGNLALDRAVYEHAYAEFGRYLRISGEGPHTGTIEIVFKSKSSSMLKHPVVSYTHNLRYGSKWYTGEPDDPAAAPLETEIARGGAFSWQNSSMLVNIKDLDGRKAWQAGYAYRGWRDPSGISVKTADEAAMLCLNRISEQFRADYLVVTPKQSEEQKPSIALLIKKETTTTPEDAVKVPESPDSRD